MTFSMMRMLLGMGHTLPPYLLEAHQTGLTGAFSFSRQLLSTFTDPVAIEGEDTEEGFWNAVRNQIEPDIGEFDVLISGDVGTKPTVGTAGPNSRVAALHDEDGAMQSLTKVLSDFISASAGYVAVSAILDSIATNDPVSFQNTLLLGDSGAFMGMYLRNSTPKKLVGYNWDGNEDHADTTIVMSTPTVFEWKHSGGNVSSRINGGSWTNAASGNTDTLTGFLSLGGFNFGGSVLGGIDGAIFEMVTYNIVPAGADTIAAGMLDWID